MTLLTFTQVVLRYVFNSGLVWALEATTYMFGWLVLFGMSYGVKVGSHIGVDVLVKTLPVRGQRAVGVLAGLLCMLYAVIIFYGGYEYVAKMHQLGVEAEDIPIERWMLLIILPIGFALLFVRLGQVTWRILAGRQEGFRLADEAREAIEQLQPEADAASAEAKRP
ncbi:MAG: TRAP transporter small permease [Alphaproteobacteria bacterium]|nr:TRAP transporter small permease [Alphaproteobacteria bacterium]